MNARLDNFISVSNAIGRHCYMNNNITADTIFTFSRYRSREHSLTITEMERVMDIARRHAEEIMMIDGVIGYGWGAWADDDGTIITPIEYAIVVGVISEEIIPLIPTEVEGFPIQVEIADSDTTCNIDQLTMKRVPWCISVTTLDGFESMSQLHSHAQTSDSDCSTP